MADSYILVQIVGKPRCRRLEYVDIETYSDLVTQCKGIIGNQSIDDIFYVLETYSDHFEEVSIKNEREYQSYLKRQKSPFKLFIELPTSFNSTNQGTISPSTISQATISNHSDISTNSVCINTPSISTPCHHTSKSTSNKKNITYHLCIRNPTISKPFDSSELIFL